MKQTFKSRILAWLLTICMVVSLIPGMAVTASAATYTEVRQSDINNGMFPVFTTGATTGGIASGSYKLMENIVLPSTAFVGKDSNVTIDLNGYTITYTTDNMQSVIMNKGTLKIEDNSQGKTGKILNDQQATGIVIRQETANNTPSLHITGGTFVATGASGGAIAALAGTVTIDGGCFEGQNNCAISCLTQLGASGTVNGGRFKAAAATGADTVLNGCTLRSGYELKASQYYTGYYVLVPVGGTETAPTYTVSLPAVANAYWTSGQNTVSGDQTVTVGTGATFTLNANEGYQLSGTLAATGGTVVGGYTVTFTADATFGSIDASGVQVTSTTPTVTVVNNAAELKQAIADQVKNIQFGADITMGDSDVLTLNYPVTIDGNGKSLIRNTWAAMLTVTDDVTITNLTVDGNRSNLTATNPMILVNGAGKTLTMTDCTLQNAKSSYEYKDGVNANVKAMGGAVNVWQGAFDATNCKFENNSTTSANGGGAVLYLSGGANVGTTSAVFTNCTMTGNSAGGAGVICANYHKNNSDHADVTINGGSITGNTCSEGALSTAMDVTLTGAVVIDNNTAGSGGVEKNIVSPRINITATGLTNGASVGITAAEGHVIGSGYEDGDEAYFSADDSALEVVYDAGSLKLAKIVSGTVTTKAQLKEALAAGLSTITLGTDITLNETLTISQDVTIQGNGYSLIRAESYTGKLLSITANVTMNDLTIDGNRDQATAAHPSIYLNGAGKTLTLNNCILKDSKNSYDFGSAGSVAQMGGAINVWDGTVVANNTTFTNNACLSGNGGGAVIYLSGGGENGCTPTATLKGCTISENGKGNGSVATSSPILSANWGKGTPNRIFGVFNLEDTTITGNASTSLFEGRMTMNLKGAVVIKENTDNLNPVNNTINNTGLTSGAEIVVEGSEGTAISGTGYTEGDKAYFSADDSALEVVYDAGSLKLAKKDFVANEYATLTNGVLSFKDTTSAGYRYDVFFFASTVPGTIGNPITSTVYPTTGSGNKYTLSSVGDLYKVTVPKVNWLPNEQTTVDTSLTSLGVSNMQATANPDGSHTYSADLTLKNLVGNASLGGDLSNLNETNKYLWVCLSVCATSSTSDNVWYYLGEYTSYSAAANAHVVTDEAELKAAVAAGGEIIIAANITLTEQLVIPEGKTVTIDLCGKTITGSFGGNQALIKNEGSLTVINSSTNPGTISNTATGQNGNCAIETIGALAINGDSVTDIVISNVTSQPISSNGDNSTVAIDGATLKGGYGGLYVNRSTATNTLKNTAIEVSNTSGGNFGIGGGTWNVEPDTVTIENTGSGTLTPVSNATILNDVTFVQGEGDNSKVYTATAATGKEVSNLAELKAALADTTTSEIILTADIAVTEDIMPSGGITKAVTIKSAEGESAPYIIKRTAAEGSTPYTGTLFTVGTNGDLKLENVTIDGGAIWSTDNGVTPANRTNSGIKIENPAQGVGLLISVSGGNVALNNVTLQNNDRICNDDNIGDDGSAVQVNSGSFTMTDSTIKDCAVSGKDTAGNQPDVNVGDGAAITVWTGTATINGGTITGNYGSRHGGVARANGGTLTLNGTNITGNYTNGDGNIAVTGGTLALSGTVKIDDNYDVNSDGTVEANVWLYSGYVTEGTAELTAGANIGVVASAAGQTVGTGFDSGDEAYFSVDGGKLDVVYDNGTLKTADNASRTVSTLAELKQAIADGVKEITLGADIPATGENAETITIPSTYNGTLDLAGFTLTGGNSGLEVSGDLTVMDSSDNKTGKIVGIQDGIKIPGTASNAKVTVNSGTIQGGNYAIFDTSTNTTGAVNGGTLIGGMADAWKGALGGDSTNKGGNWTIATDGNVTLGSTGTVADPADLIRSDTLTSVNGDIAYSKQTDGSYKVVKGYNDLESINNAIANATGPITITLSGNVGATINIPNGKNVVLDLNGYSVEGYTCVNIEAGGTLTVMDSNPKPNNDNGLLGSAYGIMNNGSLTVNSGFIRGNGHEGIQNTSTATKCDLNGGTIQGGYAAICDYAQPNGSTGSNFSIADDVTLIRTGGGNGYVINSYGSGKGATWIIDNGVTMQNTVAGKWVNTPLDGQSPGYSQVGVADYDQIVYNVTGTYTAIVSKNEGNKTTAKAALVSGDLEMENLTAESVTFYAAPSGVANSTAQTAPDGAVEIGTGTATGGVVDLASVTGNLDALTDPNNVLWAKIGEQWFCLGEFDSWNDAARPDDLATAKSELIDAIGDMNLPTTGSMNENTLTEMVNDITEPGATSDNLALEQAKVNAKLDAIRAAAEQAAAINGRTDLTDAEKADLLGKLETALTAAISAIDSANSETAVELAEAKLEAKADVIDKAADSLAAISNMNDLSDAQKAAEKAKITGDSGTLADAISGIEAATDESGVSTAKQNGVTAIEAIVTEAGALGTAAKNAKEAIDSKATDEKAAIDAMENLSDDEKATLKAAVDAAASAAKTAIDNATTSGEVETAKTNGTAAIDLVGDKAAATAEINKASADKKAAIEALTNISPEKKAELKTAVDTAASDANTAINNATTPEAVATAKNDGITAINAIYAEAVAADNLIAGKKSAVDTINKAAIDKKAEIDALPYLTAERKAELKAEVDTAAETAIGNINAATTPEGVTTAMNNGIEAINAVAARAVAENTALAAFVHTITFDANGGNVYPTSAETGTDSKLASLPTPARNGWYIFDGWYTAKNGGTRITTSTVFTEDTTIYAHWSYIYIPTPSYYTLTFDVNGGTAISSVRRVSGTVIDLTKYTSTREGYEFDGWYSDAALRYEITSVKLTKNTTVYAGWTKIVETPDPIVNPFKDIFTSDWYYDDVMYVYEKDLMDGTGNGMFSPSITTTRGMIVTILYRLEGEPSTYGLGNPFTDLTQDWYVDAVKWAAANKIVEGYGNGKYGPEDPITREQMATILWRYAKYKGVDVSSGATMNITGYADDETISAYALPAMKWTVAEGIIGGYNGYLTPADCATRGQVAAILHRYCLLIAEE